MDLKKKLITEMKRDLREIQMLKKIKNSQRAESPKGPSMFSTPTRNRIATNFTQNHFKFSQIMDGPATHQTEGKEVSVLSTDFMLKRKRS
jgi:hypothetical protein